MRTAVMLAALLAFWTADGARAAACSFDSDCAYGKCRNGKCGACSFDSDCKGHGKCRSGWCTQAAWRTRGGCPSLAEPGRGPWICSTSRRGPLWGDLVVGACGTEAPATPRFDARGAR